MDIPSLAQSTGSQYVDRLLRGIAGIYAQIFPTRIGAVYIMGSYADESAVPLSDIDLCILFKDVLATEEKEQAQTLAYFCGQLSSIRLDISVAGENDLSVAERIMLKQGSLLINGEDMRDHILLPSLDDYRKYVTWGPYRFLGQIIRDCLVLSYPLTYPDNESEFYGYERKRIPEWYEWYSPEIDRGTKELVTGVLRTATAMIALKTGQYVGSKHECVQLYRQYIHDEWTDYLEMLYEKGKREWHYLIPTGSADQLLLRSLCQQTLAFENAYFSLYRTYLLDLLQQTDEGRIFALKRLTEVVYTDEEMLKTLQVLSHSSIQEVQQASHHALECLQKVINNA